MRFYLVLFAAFVLTLTAAGAEKKTSGGGPADSASDLDLNGIWRGFVVVGRGEQPDRGTVQLELKIKGKHIKATRLDGQPGPLGEGSYTLSTSRYYVMDATEIRSHGTPRSYQGIVAFGPDLMKWCVSTPNNPRPTGFETRGSQFLLILKRQR
jgi:hypothetical protein